MRERWPNERRSAAPNQRWLLRSSSVFLAMASHTLLLEFAHVALCLGWGWPAGTTRPAVHLVAIPSPRIARLSLVVSSSRRLLSGTTSTIREGYAGGPSGPP